MSTTDDARAEAERITMHTEDRGRSEWLLVAGAEWQASHKVEITAEMVTRADAAYWRDVDAGSNPMRTALEAALGGGE